jgi:hypothetical protein
LPVIDTAGTLLFFVDDTRGRELLRAHKARLIRRNGRDRALLATGEIRRGELRLLGRGLGLDHVRYSHRRETEDNPRNCWTLVRQPSRAVFERVLADCVRPARSGGPAIEAGRR